MEAFITILIILLFLVLTIRAANRSKNGNNRNYDWCFNERSHHAEGLEDIVDRKIRVTEGHGGLVLNNCYLRWKNGTTTEIDNILICSSGVYVIECKDYSGWIFGDGHSENWTQTFSARYGEEAIKQQFRNPIIQNRNHVKCVRQKLLPMKVPIHNMVVFSDNSTFMKISNVGEAYVSHPDGLIDAIKDIHLKYKGSISDYEKQEIYDILAKDVVVTPEVEEEHIRNVQKIKAKKYFEQNYYGKTCPRCGGMLVLRNGKYGQYYGCFNYPHCTYTRRKTNNP